MSKNALKNKKIKKILKKFSAFISLVLRDFKFVTNPARNFFIFLLNPDLKISSIQAYESLKFFCGCI
jgi:hypothetical protein